MASRSRDKDWIARLQQSLVRLLVFLLLVASNTCGSY